MAINLIRASDNKEEEEKRKELLSKIKDISRQQQEANTNTVRNANIKWSDNSKQKSNPLSYIASNFGLGASRSVQDTITSLPQSYAVGLQRGAKQSEQEQSTWDYIKNLGKNIIKTGITNADTTGVGRLWYYTTIGKEDAYKDLIEPHLGIAQSTYNNLLQQAGQVQNPNDINEQWKFANKMVKQGGAVAGALISQEGSPLLQSVYNSGQVYGQAWGKDEANKKTDSIMQFDENIHKGTDKWAEDLAKEGESQNKLVSLLGEGSQTIGYMTPGILTSFLSGGASGSTQAGIQAGNLALMGLSAKSSATREGLKQGLDLETAETRGVGTGTKEAGTEMMWSGVAHLGKIKSGGIEDSIKNWIGKTIDSKFTSKATQKIFKGVGNWLVDVTGESVEELVADIYDTWLDQATVDPNKQYTLNDALHTIIGTVISTTGMNGGYKALNLGKQAYQKIKSKNKAITQNNQTITDTQQKASDNYKSNIQGMLNNIQLPEQLKQQFQEEINSKDIIDKEGYEDIKKSIKEQLKANTEVQMLQVSDTLGQQKANIENQLLELDNIKPEDFKNPESRKFYAQQINNEYDSTIMDNILPLYPENRNGRRTVKQYKEIATQYGKAMAENGLSFDEVRANTVGAWQYYEPSKNITRYDNQQKRNQGFEKLNSQVWSQLVYDSYKDTMKTQLQQQQEALYTQMNDEATRLQDEYEVLIDTIDNLGTQETQVTRTPEEVERTKKLVEDFAKNRGVKVEYNADVFNNNNEEAFIKDNGKGDRTIYINPNADPDTILVKLATHEMFHDTIRTQPHDKLTQLVMDKLKADENYNTYRESVREAYAEELQGKTQAEQEALLDEEMTAKYLGEYLGDEQFVQQLVNSTNRTTIQKIMDWIDNRLQQIKNIVTGNTEAEYWRKVRENFEKAYNSKYQGKEGTQFSKNIESQQDSFNLPQDIKEIKNYNQFLRDASNNEANVEWKNRLADALVGDISTQKGHSLLSAKKELIRQYLDYKNEQNNTNVNDNVTTDNQSKTTTNKDAYKTEPKEGTIRLYTNTSVDNIDSILRDGLLVSKAKQKEYSGNMTWFETTPDLKGYGGTTIAVDIPKNSNMSKVNNTQYTVYNNISPESIVFIDKPLMNNNRTSDIQSLLEKYGEEKVREVFEKAQENNKAYVSEEEFNRLLENAQSQEKGSFSLPKNVTIDGTEYEVKGKETSPYQRKTQKEWDIDSIQEQLKKEQSPTTSIKEELDKFKSFDEMKDNIFYHGSIGYNQNLKAGSTLREDQRTGGYGEAYHTISLSKNRNLASNFASMGSTGVVTPVLLREGARVIKMDNVSDSIELEDYLPELWKNNIDAVELGEGSEEELVVLNPKAITVIDKGRTNFKNYGKPKFQNLNAEDLEALYQEYKDQEVSELKEKINNETNETKKETLQKELETLQKKSVQDIGTDNATYDTNTISSHEQLREFKDQVENEINSRYGDNSAKIYISAPASGFIIEVDNKISGEEFKQRLDTSDSKELFKQIRPVLSELTQEAGFNVEDIINPNTNNNVTTDNQGRTLTKEQQEYFKNESSEFKNSKGNLTRFYSGSSSQFTVFNATNQKMYGNSNVNFFTDNQDVAKSYGKELYEVYIKSENPYVLEGDTNGTTLEYSKTSKEELANNEEIIQTIREKLDKNISRFYKKSTSKVAQAILENKKNILSDSEVNYLVEHPFSLAYLSVKAREGFYHYSRSVMTNDVVNAVLQINEITNNKYDAVMFKSIVDSGQLDNDKSYSKSNVVAAFEPNQIKNIDNLKPTDNPDIRYSKKTAFDEALKEDNQGRELSENQQEYFKDSKVRDENGNLKTLFHVTDKDFNVFESDKFGQNTEGKLKGIYMSEKPIGIYGDRAIELYANIKNPVAPGDKNITKEQYTQLIKDYVKENNIESSWARYKNSDDLTKLTSISNLYKSNKQTLQSFYDKVKSITGYDGAIYSGNNYYGDGKTAYVAFDSNQVKNVDNLKPTENPDIRYNKKSTAFDEYLKANNPNRSGVTLGDLKNLPSQQKLPTKQKATQPILPTQQNNIATEKATTNLPIQEDTITVPLETNENQLPSQKQRKAYQSIIESPVMSDEAKKVARKYIGQDTYVPDSNKQQLARADKLIEINGVEDSLNSLEKKAIKGDTIKAEDIAIGDRLIQYYSLIGDSENLQKAVRAVALAGTQAGRSVQAFNLLRHQTPQGMVVWIKNSVDKLNLKTKNGQFNFTPEMQQKIASSTEENLQQNVDEVMKELGQQVPVNIMGKIDAWRYFSMLANPKTHIRNIVGNFAMGLSQQVKSKIAGTIEQVARQDRTHTSLFEKRSKENIKFAKQDLKNVTSQLGMGENKYVNPKNQIQQNQRVFKSDALENTLGKMFKLNDNLLEAEDNFGLKNAYIRNLSDYMTANKLNPNTITNEQLQQARKVAIEESLRATFHQASDLASLINQFENKNLGTKLLVGGLVPFKKTPINVAKSGFGYSPVGLAKTIVYDTVQLRKGNINANQYIDNLSQGLTGTGIALVGYALAEAGILKAGGDDDKEDKYKEAMGEQPYSIMINGKSYSLDWLAPSGIPLFVGAELNRLVHDTEETSEESENKIYEALGRVTEATTSLLNPMSEMSMISGLTSSLKSYSQGTGALMDIPTNMIKSYAGQFVPTALGQVARTLDTYERDTSSTAKGTLAKAIDSTKNQMMSKIPGLRQMLPTKKDIWGEEIETQDYFHNAVLPYTKKEIKTNPVDKELNDLYEKTGENIYPNTSLEKTVTYEGSKTRLTNQDYNDFKTNYGKTSYKLLDSLISSKEYSGMTDEQKVKAVKDVYTYANNLNKTEYAEKKGIDFKVPSDVKQVRSIKANGGTETDYFKYKGLTDGLTKESEKMTALKDSSLSTKSKRAVYISTIGSDDTFYQNTNIGINDYLGYKTADIQGVKDSSGKTISGSVKQAQLDYINKNISGYENRLLLMGKNYKLSRTQQQDLANYINTLDNAEDLFSELSKNFTVSNGTVYYK